MRPLIIRFAVAAITFIIGITIFLFFGSHRPQQPKPSSKVVDENVVEAPSNESISGQDLKIKEESDLSIGVGVSEPNPHPPSLQIKPVTLAKKGTTFIDLDLGESIDGQKVVLSFAGDSTLYRVFQRYRTSMSISAEGPHLDLIDWRHFDSPWIPLKSLDSRSFQMLRSDQMDQSRFPPTTRAEIVQEVKGQVGKEWPQMVEIAKDCDGPNEGECRVMISSIYLRIQKQIRARWIDIGVVEVRISMGC
jgi:hypothetical protein